jgi:hypothetical protein
LLVRLRTLRFGKIVKKGLWAAAAVALAMAPGTAFGQARSAGNIAQARELLNQGEALRKKGDLSGAAEKLKAADALIHTPITAIELGRTYLALGKLVEARESFLSVARIPVTQEETARSAAARADSATLADQVRPRIPSLVIRVTGAPTDAVAVSVDGASIPTDALGAPRLVNPGSHSIVAKSTAGGSAETTVDVKEGEARDVQLAIAPAPARASTTAPAPTSGATASAALGEDRGPDSPPSPSRALPWTLVVAGAAVGVAGGVVMGVESGQAGDASNRHDKSSYDSAASLWTVGLVGTIVGAAAVVGGGVLFAVPSRGAESPHAARRAVWIGAGPGNVVVGGSW